MVYLLGFLLQVTLIFSLFYFMFRRLNDLMTSVKLCLKQTSSVTSLTRSIQMPSRVSKRTKKEEGDLNVPAYFRSKGINRSLDVVNKVDTFGTHSG